MNRRSFLQALVGTVGAAVLAWKHTPALSATFTPAMVRAASAPCPDLFNCRLDVLYGWAVVRPELCCRITA